jgi:ADP-ribose pyrophosphatase
MVAFQVMKKNPVVFKGKVFSVTQETVNEPGGVRVVREIIRHPGSSVVIAQNDAGELLLVSQYRYAARQKLWEVVAGRIDPGETPLAAARRELAEEAGYAAKRWTKLGVFYPSPGFMDERMWLYLAEELSPAHAEADPDERIVKRWFPRLHVDEMIRKGKIVDAKTVLCYFLSQPTQLTDIPF